MSWLKKIIISCLTVFALLSAPLQVEACGNVCTSVSINSVPGCSLQARACKCCSLFHGCKYKIDVRDPTTGIVGDSDYHGDANSAALYGIYNLFRQDNGCNCHSMSNIPYGTCKLGGKTCFYFSSPGAISSKSVSYRIYIHDESNPKVEGEADASNTNSIKQAILSAFQSLTQKENLAHCTSNATDIYDKVKENE